MAKDISWSLDECLEMFLHIREQEIERTAAMIMVTIRRETRQSHSIRLAAGS